MKEVKVRLTLTEEMLGTATANEQIYTDYIGSNAPDAPSLAEEVEALGADAVEEKAMTVFPKDTDGCPIMWDYQVKGFFKDTCGALKRVSGTRSEKLKAFKKEIDGLIFPEPRKIRINVNGEIGNCQRPLRAQTAQGERIALANSETVPAGSTIEFKVVLLKDDHEKLLKEWLDYGRYKGIGQWRNSGKGRFEVEYLDDQQR